MINYPNKFYEQLAYNESRHDPRVLNKFGYAGLFQMGEAALQDMGYYKGDGTRKNDWRGAWTGKDGINSLEDFLNSPYTQLKAAQSYHSILWNRLKPLHSYVGKTVAGIQLTKAGIIAVSHLIGDGGFKNFLADPNGKHEDAFGTKATTYLKDFANFDIDSINPQTHNIGEPYSQDDTDSSNQKQSDHEKPYTIQDMFKSFDETKVLKQDISNRERFLKMAEHEANKGKPGVAEMYQNMARQQGLIEDFFKSMPGRASQSSDNDDEL